MSTFTSAQIESIANYVALTNPTWEVRGPVKLSSGATTENIIYRTGSTQPWNNYDLSGFDYWIVTEFFQNFRESGGGWPYRPNNPVAFSGAELQEVADYLQITGVVQFARVIESEGRIVTRNSQNDPWTSYTVISNFDFYAAAQAVATAKGQ